MREYSKRHSGREVQLRRLVKQKERYLRLRFELSHIQSRLALVSSSHQLLWPCSLDLLISFFFLSFPSLNCSVLIHRQVIVASDCYGRFYGHRPVKQIAKLCTASTAAVAASPLCLSLELFQHACKQDRTTSLLRRRTRMSWH